MCCVVLHLPRHSVVHFCETVIGPMELVGLVIMGCDSSSILRCLESGMETLKVNHTLYMYNNINIGVVHVHVQVDEKFNDIYT